MPRRVKTRKRWHDGGREKRVNLVDTFYITNSVYFEERSVLASLSRSGEDVRHFRNRPTKALQGTADRCGRPGSVPNTKCGVENRMTENAFIHLLCLLCLRTCGIFAIGQGRRRRAQQIDVNGQYLLQNVGLRIG